MISPAWHQEYRQAKPKGKSLWLQILIAVSASLLISLVALGLHTRNVRTTAWQGFRSVMAQIRNESDAKSLYRRSPKLVTRFPNEVKFLDYLKTYQSVLQIPPFIEPMNDGDKYLVFSLPTSATVRFRFADGTTVSVGIESPGFFRSNPEGQEVLSHFDLKAARMLMAPK